MSVCYDGFNAEREERERYERALEMAEVGLWEFRRKDSTVWMNSAGRAFFGLDQPGSNIELSSVMRAIHPDDVPGIEAQLRGRDDFRATYRTNEAMVAPRWLRSFGRWTEKRGERRLTGVTIDVTTEMQRQAEAGVLIREMRHRTGNLFSILGGLTMLNAATETTAAGLARSLKARLSSLARSHALSLGDDDPILQRATLKGLIETLIDPFTTGHDSGATGRARFHLDGPSMALTERSRTALSLVIYEWLTNAVKYGALSVENGRIAISWRIERDEIVMTWTENGGPPVAYPTTSGFGDRLQTVALSGIKGVAEREWRPEGLVVRLRASASLVIAGAVTALETGAPTGSRIAGKLKGASCAAS